MASKETDPTEAMRLRASRYPEVDEGTACTQSSFKTNKKSFFFVGMQGGRYKAMFKLNKSMPRAAALAAKEPDRYETGSTGWVTARFTADKPMPKAVWERWLDESYELSRPTPKPVRAAKKGPTAKPAKTSSTHPGSSSKKRRK